MRDELDKRKADHAQQERTAYFSEPAKDRHARGLERDAKHQARELGNTLDELGAHRRAEEERHHRFYHMPLHPDNRVAIPAVEQPAKTDWSAVQQKAADARPMRHFKKPAKDIDRDR